MQLSKRITHIERFNWCKKDFMKMCQKYRKIRSRLRNPMDKCHWCKRKFIDGEIMALSQPTKGNNLLSVGIMVKDTINQNITDVLQDTID